MEEGTDSSYDLDSLPSDGAGTDAPVRPGSPAPHQQGQGPFDPIFESPAVIGVAGTTGSIEALRRFFMIMPPNNGMSFVVMLDPFPDAPALVRILEQVTSMTVCPAESGMAMHPDTVYLTPSDRSLVIDGDTFCKAEPVRAHGERHPIDHFLRALATGKEERSVAVLLSGVGRDCAEGIRAIRGAGGVVIVQQPEGRPLSDLAPGVPESAGAKLLFPVEQIPGKLIELVRFPSRLAVRKRLTLELDEQLHDVFRLVKSRTGHDFSSYKTNTVMRRIERRMMVHGTEGLKDYLDLLKENPREAEELSGEFLIGVTSFFRDPEAFEILGKTVIPRLFADREPENPVRIWHACCSTGEEAYSTAMLIREYLGDRERNPGVQIFATDLDEKAVARARAGAYPAGIEADLSDERLRRFFTVTDGRYQVTKQLREMIIFAHHNVIRDPPFSRLDLLVCRNFLIYLKPMLQARLIALFHQVLKPGGILFLGSSETIERHTDLFHPIDRKWRLFERREGERRVDTALRGGPAVRIPAANGCFIRTAGCDAPDPGAAVEKLLMERYSPPCVVVNEQYEVVHVSTRPNHFLEVPLGEPTRDVLKMAREELRPTLRAAIHKAFTEQKRMAFRGVRVLVNGQAATVNILAEPVAVSPPGERLAMVVFEPSAAAPAAVPPGSAEVTPAADSSKDALIRQLEEQLRISHEQLQATIEQLETSNEGLMASNEELLSTNEEFQSTNEELQSINEELETSKEELQSLNEELATVNTALNNKVDELNQATGDMENLLNSSEIATVFLDRGLNIKRFTPAMTRIFDLIPSDIGRPFRHMAGSIKWNEFARDAELVMLGQSPAEQEVATLESGRCCIMRVLPYRTPEGGVDGIVVTFIDITERKRSEEALLRAKEEWECTFNSVPDLIAILDERHRIVRVNRAMAERLGRTKEQCAGLTCHAAIHGTDEPPLFCPHVLTLSDGGEHTAEVRERSLGGVFLVSTTPLRDPVGNMAGTVHVARDITESKRAETELLRSKELLRRLTDHLPCYVSFVDREERFRFVNETYRSWFGLDPAEVLGLRVDEFMGQENYRVIKPRIDEALSGRKVDFDYWMSLRDGSRRYVNTTYVPDRGGDGEVHGFYVTTIDLTERVRNEEALRESEDRWQFAIEGSTDGVWDRDIQKNKVYFSRRWKEMLGYSEEEIGSGPEEWSRRIHPEDAERVRQELHRHLRGETGHYSAEFRMRCKDGSYKWILARGRVITRAEDGGPLRFVGTHSDISERKNLETQLYQAQKMEAVGQLAGGIAHDFNNILTAIIGYAHLLSLHVNRDDKVRGYVEQIRASAERAADLTKALLTFSRKRALELKTVNLNDTVTAIRTILTRLVSEDIELSFELYPEKLFAMADSGKIEQVLMNLVTNAKDAMPCGGTIAIATSPVTIDEAREKDPSLPPGEYVLISVGDSGTGMDEDTKRRIFEPFFTTKEVGKGTGLGLSIAYGIIEQHSGHIRVQSEPGKGSVFSILLPAIRSGDTVGTKERATRPPDGTETILLAEDDPGVREFHTTLFESAGYVVLTASHGLEAVELFETSGKDIDLLVFDVMMPHMNGWEAFDLISRIRPGIPALFLSGYAGELLHEAGIAPGREILLDKPVQPDELLAKVHDLLRSGAGSPEDD